MQYKTVLIYFQHLALLVPSCTVGSYCQETTFAEN